MEKKIKKVSFDESASNGSLTNDSSVKNLRKRFESISVTDKKAEVVRPGLVRSQTMRNPAKFQHQKPAVVPKPRPALKDFWPPENIYENAPIPTMPLSDR